MRPSVHILVYIESHETMEAAITREKRIKRWRREWKLALIERDNPTSLVSPPAQGSRRSPSDSVSAACQSLHTALSPSTVQGALVR
ncbi:excinuclease ABC subunit C [Paramagnetospirillum caucaseum]|uniref:Excinuclease ABC subunit C n=1 Tax=Paramagnetospirillum caucaseum TaxID=1244869 RepID=M3A4H8_9PROT|nr:excinuclease ABC subunit C [Paramagnetospirillum caucaseum]